jgi:putative ABC transport system permease protein
MTFAGLAARNLLRNKVRTALTVAGVAVAVVTFLLLRTAVASWTAAADYAAKDRLVTRHKVTFVMTLPKRYAEQVRQAPGVTKSSYAVWFGGKVPTREDVFFATFAVDAATYLEVVPEILVGPAEKEAFLLDRTGLLVGDVLAAKLGWKVGDKVSLESSIYPAPPDEPWAFTVRGLYTSKSPNVDRSSVLFHYAYLNDRLPEARRDQIGFILSRVADPTRTADVGVAIDKLFEDKEIQTLSQDEHAFNQSFLAGFSAVLTAFDIISVVILAIMALVLGNTIAMGVRERTSEIATLRAIGFSPRHVALFVLGEAVVLGTIGGALGVALSYPLLERGLGRWVEQNLGSIIPFFRIPASAAVLAFFLAVGLGLLSAMLPARTAARIGIIEGLRRVA